MSYLFVYYRNVDMVWSHVKSLINHVIRRCNIDNFSLFWCKICEDWKAKQAAMPFKHKSTSKRRHEREEKANIPKWDSRFICFVLYIYIYEPGIAFQSCYLNRWYEHGSRHKCRTWNSWSSKMRFIENQANDGWWQGKWLFRGWAEWRFSVADRERLDRWQTVEWWVLIVGHKVN